MNKWYSILFFHLCYRPYYSQYKCSKFCLLYICSILFFIVSYVADAQNNTDVIHQSNLKRTLELRNLILSHNAGYDGKDIVVQSAAVKSTARDSLALQKQVPYISIALIIFVLAIVVKFLLLPEIHFEEDQSVTHPNVFQQVVNVLKDPQSVLGVIVLILILYMSSGVLAGNPVDSFVERSGVNVSDMNFYQKLILVTITAMVIGCVLGMALIPKYVSLVGFLKFSCFLGVLLAVAIFFISPCTMIALPGVPELPVVIILVALMGFVNALFWPVIWSVVIQDFRNL